MKSIKTLLTLLIASVCYCSSMPTLKAVDSLALIDSFSNPNGPTANGSITGNINLANLFTIYNLQTGVGTGIFTGLATQSFSTISFDSTVNTSLSFGDGYFGTFQSTLINDVVNFQNAVAIRGFNIEGDLTEGTFFTTPGTVVKTLLTLTYNQTPSASNPLGAGVISDSATFATVPEPSTYALFGIGALALAIAARRKIA